MLNSNVMSLDDDTVFPDSPVTRRREPKRGRRAAASGRTGQMVYGDDSDGADEALKDDGPPHPRKMGGWAVEPTKDRRGKRQDQVETLSSDDDRFNANSDDEIAIIPDLDDVQEEELATQIAAPPSVQVTRLDTFKKLDTELHKHAGLATLDGDIDLKLLTKVLAPEVDIIEDDELWEWDRLFTQVSSELQQEYSRDGPSPTSPHSPVLVQNPLH